MKPRNTTMQVRGRQSKEQSRKEAIERIYHDWDEALSLGDVEALLALYAPNAILESPLVSHLLDKEEGICTGHDELRRLFEILRERKPPVRRHYRAGFFTDGKKLIWEYPRATPKGEQMDFAEAMEIDDKGLIRHHNVYWGWFGVRVLQRNEYHKRTDGAKLSESGRYDSGKNGIAGYT